MDPQPHNNACSFALPRDSGEAALPKNALWILDEAETRLGTHFPSLLERLKVAVQGSTYDRSFAHFAAEHVLTTEALVEVLEENSNRHEKFSGSEFESAFQQRVVEKVSRFLDRSIEERELIKRVHPMTDPKRIALALKHGLISDHDPIWALQQTAVYFSEVIPRLAQAGLLPEEECAQIPGYLLQHVCGKTTEKEPRDTNRGLR